MTTTHPTTADETADRWYRYMADDAALFPSVRAYIETMERDYRAQAGTARGNSYSRPAETAETLRRAAAIFDARADGYADALRVLNDAVAAIVDVDR